MQTRVDPPAGGRESAATSPEQVLADAINGRSHAFVGELRLRTEHHGTQTAEARLDAADERDVIAAVRDLAARTRDDAADLRASGVRGAGRLDHAARSGELAEDPGALAAGDRHAAADDREQAARERLQALVDREILADELAVTANDPLTGARTRAAGLIDLDRELNRCRRSGDRLIVVYVDVVGLKALNDTRGHSAGDDLLTLAVQTIRTHLRPYDLVIRMGGDEFLCAMPSMSLTDARERFAIIAAALTVAPATTAVRVGVAELRTGDDAAQLIARADAELLGAGHTEHATTTEVPARRRPHDRRPARPESVGPLRRAVVAFACGGGASPRECEDVAIAVSEALNNAVLHAYAGNESPGIVAVDAWMSERWLDVVVSDEGTGMLPRTGRLGLGLGLSLIVRMTHRLAIEESARGMRVRMTFAIG